MYKFHLENFKDIHLDSQKKNKTLDRLCLVWGWEHAHVIYNFLETPRFGEMLTHHP